MTTITTTTATSTAAKKQPTGLKKVLKYFQDQAAQNSTSNAAIYLSPPGKEPQQRISRRHRQPQIKPGNVTRTLSNATTAVEPQRQHQYRQTHQRGQASASHNNNNNNNHTEMRPSQLLSQKIRKIQYASENLLQSYELYQPENLPQHIKDHGYWILYIHGGYFRDPKVDASTFRPALSLLTSTEPTPITEESESSSTNSTTSLLPPNFSHIQRHTAGYASINYRLSASAAYPQDPDTTLKYEKRNARYPDQLNDIVAAIKHLNSRYDFGNRYILTGHSVGATLAFLTSLHAAEKDIPSPTCVVGLNGIYDFPEIHRTNPGYEDMTRSALTSAQDVEASPALYPPSKFVVEGRTTRYLLSHSRDDELVGRAQVEEMETVLVQAKLLARHAGSEFVSEVLETRGKHDEIWERGTELARSIAEGMRIAAA